MKLVLNWTQYACPPFTPMGRLFVYVLISTHTNGPYGTAREWETAKKWCARSRSARLSFLLVRKYYYCVLCNINLIMPTQHPIHTIRAAYFQSYCYRNDKKNYYTIRSNSGYAQQLYSKGLMDFFSYNATENTAANQNAGKPFCIRRYYTQLSHQAPRVCRIDIVGYCIQFYGMV